MPLSDILAFALVAGLLTLTPGPNGLLVARTVPTSGKAAGFATVVGIAGAFYLHGALSILGLSVILLHSTTLFLIFKIAGAAYLCWIGAKALWTAWTMGTAPAAPGRPGAPPPHPGEGRRRRLPDQRAEPQGGVVLPGCLPAVPTSGQQFRLERRRLGDPAFGHHGHLVLADGGVLRPADPSHRLGPVQALDPGGHWRGVRGLRCATGQLAPVGLPSRQPGALAASRRARARTQAMNAAAVMFMTKAYRIAGTTISGIPSRLVAMKIARAAF